MSQNETPGARSNVAREPEHIVIRFSDKLGATADTIEAHTRVIDKYGVAWFGKMGKTLALRHVERINEQCEIGIPTHLYLVQSSRQESRVYRGDLLQIARRLPLDQKRFIPNYYQENDLVKYMTLWGKLSSLKLIDSSYLTRLYVASSGSPVSQVLGASMAGLFIVRERARGFLAVTRRSRFLESD